MTQREYFPRSALMGPNYTPPETETGDTYPIMIYDEAGSRLEYMTLTEISNRIYGKK